MLSGGGISSSFLRPTNLSSRDLFEKKSLHSSVNVDFLESVIRTIFPNSLMLEDRDKSSGLELGISSANDGNFFPVAHGSGCHALGDLFPLPAGGLKVHDIGDRQWVFSSETAGLIGSEPIVGRIEVGDVLHVIKRYICGQRSVWMIRNY